ncbi:hypothetical protein NUW58_g7452 [Xylaria curta]|uniref:Uncharacterized protein n=1 Tax=Xylaria curta TaxID=42375 RepID=A0ACC1NGW9_9PEZI|nr:hypothetical protein NUW58_g7452 [Xylaria curta]
MTDSQSLSFDASGLVLAQDSADGGDPPANSQPGAGSSANALPTSDYTVASNTHASIANAAALSAGPAADPAASHSVNTTASPLFNTGPLLNWNPPFGAGQMIMTGAIFGIPSTNNNPPPQYPGPAPAPVLRQSSVVCVVCGGICKPTIASAVFEKTPEWMRPSLVQGKSGYLEWQKQTSSGLAPDCEHGGLINEIQVDTFTGGSRGMTSGPKAVFINTQDELIKIPIHVPCFDVARHFCKNQALYKTDFRSPYCGVPSSMEHLYEIWCKRAIATCPLGLVNKPIREANKYLGAPVFDLEADYHDAMAKDPSLRCFLANPVVIPGITDIVVNSNLQTIDGKDIHEDKAQLLSRIRSLPPEIVDIIIDSLYPFWEKDGIPLEPTRIMPSTWWKRELLSGRLIPWLWELNDEDIVRYRVKNLYQCPDQAAKDKAAGTYIFDENMWDWELLCRQLAQPNVCRGGGVLGDRSEKLWNRHRIWNLLDAARLGHVWLLR